MPNRMGACVPRRAPRRAAVDVDYDQFTAQRPQQPQSRAPPRAHAQAGPSRTLQQQQQQQQAGRLRPQPQQQQPGTARQHGRAPPGPPQPPQAYGAMLSELTAKIAELEAMVNTLMDTNFQVVATTLVDVPYYANQPVHLGDLRTRAGVVPAGTQVHLTFPQVLTKELVFMHMRVCDPRTGSCSVMYFPVGRRTITDENLYRHLQIRSTDLPDDFTDQFVYGFHLPGTQDQGVSDQSDPQPDDHSVSQPHDDYDEM